MRYPDSSVVQFAPNALGEPTQATTPTASYAVNVTHHPNDALAGYTLGNGVEVSQTLNVRGLPQLSQHAGVLKDRYTYDRNGNVSAIADEVGSFSREMTYDGLDRLLTTAAPSAWGQAKYTYDALDNIRTINIGSRSRTLHYDDRNRLEREEWNGGSPTAYSYDERGNIRAKGSDTYTFDLGNRLRASPNGGGSYKYDGHGRRTWTRGLGGSQTFYVYGQAGQLLWAESLGGISPGATAYVHVGSQLIAEVSSGVPTYVHTDPLGSPQARTSTQGTVAERTMFEPFGAVVLLSRSATAQPAANIGFTGHVHDVNTNLVYMQQRYYDPVAGRFLSVDPVTTNAKTGDFFGRYHYADNNPYKFVDPDGRWVVGAVYGAIAGGTGGFVSSGGSFREKVVGTVTGALAGGAVGFVAPQTSHFVGLAAAGAVASLAGQASGSASNAAMDKGPANVTMSDVKVDATTTALGALGAGVGGQVGKGISQMTMRPIIGQTLEKAGTPTTAGMVAGSVVEGAIVGGAEKAAPTVSKAVNDAAQRIKDVVSK